MHSRRILKTCSVALGLLLCAAPTARSEAQTPAPEASVRGFSVLDMQGHTQHYDSLQGKVTVVIFFSTRCPMSNAFNFRRNVLYKDYRDRVNFVMVDSNANESLDEVRTYAQNVGFDFPVYRDIENQTADVLGARGTTETFVLDRRGTIRYRGPIEDSPNPERSKFQGLRLAVDAVLAGQPVAVPQARAQGCAIRRSHP